MTNEVMTKQKAIVVSYRNLVQEPAWHDIIEAINALIEEEKEKVFMCSNKDDAEEYRCRVTGMIILKEFINAKVINSKNAMRG